MSQQYSTQNSLLLKKLMKFYSTENNKRLDTILPIINGESPISLRLVDWYATNYTKKYFTVLQIKDKRGFNKRFKVYNDYKLQLKAHSKKRFDPFCRWERINFPYKDDCYVQTTIGQLNFFKWLLENGILTDIEKNLENIENDMNQRNSTSKKKVGKKKNGKEVESKTSRKKREELSISATKSIKKEQIKIVVRFD